MDHGLLRLGAVPLTAVLLVSVGCAGGDPVSGFTSPNSSFGPPGDTGGSSGNPVTTFEPSTGMMTNGGSGDTGPGDAGTGDSTGLGCVPEPEVCDGLDDDCDGVEDNGDPGGGEDCDTGMIGECAAGQTACEAGMVVCNAIHRAVTEMCNGLDDDCDGTVDNDDPQGGGACMTGLLGVCAAGTEECQSGGIVCTPDQTPSAETCDNEDDDCNGMVDDGNPGGGGGCVTGQPGICSAGTNACVGGVITCQQDMMAAPAETCGDGLDDDCNGMADDGCGPGTCPFGLCELPAIPQVAGCDPCVDQVCLADPFCCSSAWDGLCVNQVQTVCLRADCVGAACAHLVCDIGVLLDLACDPCVATICLVDPFCCSNSWDGLCVSEVATECLLTCP